MRYTSLAPIAHIDNPSISTFLELTQPCRCKLLSLYIQYYTNNTMDDDSIRHIIHAIACYIQ